MPVGLSAKTCGLPVLILFDSANDMKRWIFTLMLLTFAPRVGAYRVPYEIWMGAYVGDAKVGCLSLKVTQDELDGVRGYRFESAIKNRLKVLGAELNQVANTVVYTDSEYNPLREEFSMSSGGKTTTVSAKFFKDRIECVISAGSGTSTKTIPIPEGVSLVGDAMFALPDSVPEIGREYNLHYFNPLMLSIDDLKVRVERKERITIGGKSYDTIVIKNSTSMGEMTLWQEPNGDVVRVDAMMGIRMIRQTKEEALAGLNGGGEDFAVRTRVKTDKPIPAPREVKVLDIVITGLDEPGMIITDARQKVKAVDSREGGVHLRITSMREVPSKSLSLPIRKPELAEYLSVTPYVDHNDKSVKEQAAEIVGDEKNSYAACSKLRAWLYSYLQVKGDIGITRSASDVLKSRVGVCRDYAILFAAMARSVGIPTKVVSGLIYLEDGFYYHAWVECYTGKWVSFDATLPTDFVDATHIKLAEGDATSMFTLAKVIGRLKAEIKGAK